MARLVFGVMGDAWGHISQALALAQALPEHEFLFMGGGNALETGQHGYAVEEIPMLTTRYLRNRVDFYATLRHFVASLPGWTGTIRRVADIIRAFRADLVLTAYEPFTPLAARQLGVPSMSVDNHHSITHCHCPRPAGQTLNRLMTSCPMKRLFSATDHFLISAFYGLQPLNPGKTKVFPPLQRELVSTVTPTDGDHILVYQTSPTFHKLLDTLATLPERFIIYGQGLQTTRSNLVFKSFSRAGFIEDLAGCHYFVTNGGHNAIAEALFLGKPVLSFPIDFAYEQFINAHMLAALGYGQYSLSRLPGRQLFLDMAQHLDQYRANIEGGFFWGNRMCAEWVNQVLAGQV